MQGWFDMGKAIDVIYTMGEIQHFFNLFNRCKEKIWQYLTTFHDKYPP